MSYRRVNSYACSFCDSKFGTQADLDLHNQLHVDTGEFSCPLCKAIFSDLHQLQLHDLRHSLEETGEEANNPSALISYIRPSSSFSCDICKEVYATNEELCIHSTIHEEAKDQLSSDSESEMEVKKEQLSPASESEVKSKKRIKKERLSSVSESEVESKMKVELLPSPPEKVRKSSRTKRTPVKNASGAQSDSDDINACHICKKIFTCASSLRRHNRRIHLNKKPYTCTICHRRFLQLSLLSRHSLLHHKNKKEIFECQYCDMNFSKSMILQKHIFMTHVCQDKHFCYACYKFFSNKNDLENHMKEHLVSETYECETCKKRYTNESDLKKHRCENRGSRRFPCKICGKRFNRLHHLERHTAVHNKKTAMMEKLAPDLFEDRKPTLGTYPDGSNDNTEEELWTVQKKFQCYICDKRWSSFRKYKQHFLTVHKEVEFNACHICSKKFAKSSKVRRHLLTHNREKKKYQCDTCDRTFTTMLTKNRHMKTCEEQRARYETSKLLDNRKKKGKNTHFECAVCGKKFVEEKFLDKHILAFHDFFTEFQCNLCERKFNSHYHLKRHMLDHADIKKYKCFRCNMTFRSRPDLKNHIQSHEEIKPFPCYFCDKFFSRNYHRQKHLAVCSKGRKVIVPKEEVIDISEEEKVDMPTTTAHPLIELVEPKSENSE